MASDTYKKTSTDDLKKREKLFKFFMGLFIPIIILLIYFAVKDYMKGEEIEMGGIVVAICSLVVMLSLFPQLNNIRKELASRDS